MYQKSKQKSESAVAASNEISRLTENIGKMVRLKEVKSKECPELNILKEKCCDNNILVAHTAFQGITKLVEQKILIPSQTITSLVSLLPSISHYSPLVTTIGNILLFDLQEQIVTNGKYECQYNFTDRSHPFVIILNHNAIGSWDAVHCFIQYLLFNHENIPYQHKIDLLKATLLYVFCNPTDNIISCKNQLFMMLLKQIERPEIKNVIIQALAWQKLDMNYCWFLQEIFHSLLNSANNDERILVIGALTPYLALAVKWLILNGHNSCLWTDLLCRVLNITIIGASAALYLLADIIAYTPAPFVNNIVDICKSIICSQSCNQFIAHKFVAVALIWLVNPSSLAEPVFTKLEYIIKFLNNNRNWKVSGCNIYNNPYYRIMENSNSDVKLAVEMSKLSDSWNENETSQLNWLNNLHMSNNVAMQKKLLPFLSGLVIRESNDEVLNICLEILRRVTKTYSDLSFFQLCVIFFKLSTEFEPKNQLKYLTSLVELANSKENVPLVIGIIETLKNDNSQVMNPLVINLYLKLWKVDDRVYPYLHKALFNSPDEAGNSWEMNVVKTIALREICRLTPSLHGKSLVPKLSKILNDCDNYVSGVPSAIAIEAVIELCKAHVIDITGTWKALKPKLGQDKRVEVIVSLCQLFSEIPSLKPCGAERDALQADVIPRLWNFVMNGKLEVIKAALNSLAKFSPTSYGPTLLPDVLKTTITIPKQYCKSADDASKEKLLNDLDYVPGECWVELLLKINPEAVSHVGDILILMMEAELESLPRRFFYQDDKMMRSYDYHHLPHSSISRALVASLKTYVNSEGLQKGSIPQSVMESLRILSHDYSKRLPPLNWSFLETFLTLDIQCRNYSLIILTRQAVGECRVSGKILENYVRDNLDHFKQAENYIFLYSALPYLCTALGGNLLRQFLDRTIRSSRNSSLHLENDSFEKVTNCIKLAMESKIVPEPRKALLVTQMENVVTGIPPEHRVMKIYAEFAVVLPSQSIELISSPSSWEEITSAKLRRSVLIRSEIALRSEAPNPLVWFNECIDAVANVLDEREFVLNGILEILRKKRELRHDDWISELMWRTQASTSSKFTPESVKVTLFLLDVFISCTLVLAGHDCFVEELHADSSQSQRFSFFPAALFELLQQPVWASLSPKIIDWIHSLAKWKNMPRIYCETLEQAVLILRMDKYCADKNKWLHLFYSSTLNSSTKGIIESDV